MSTPQESSRPCLHTIAPQGPSSCSTKVAPDQATRVGFLLLNDYSMIAFANAIEVLRMANYLSRRTLYTWDVVPAHDASAASNGLKLTTASTFEDLAACDIVLVCGGIDVRAATDADLRNTLRHLAARRVPLGALCTGSYALASAGLLDGYRCAVHWENLAAMREEFPNVVFAQAVFTIDRDRYTCSGGTAPLDMALHLVRERHGSQLATQISEQFILERQRASTDRQHMPKPECIGPGYQHLTEAGEIMAANIEEPLTLQEIANVVGISLRQLERLFDRYYSMNPAQYYMNLRLRRARELLTHSTLPIMQITIACGFQSSSHFCKAYRNLFGHPPSEERRRFNGESMARKVRRGSSAGSAVSAGTKAPSAFSEVRSAA
jgi:transcriptional regulator GlxA family with amidase domain